MKVSSLTFAGLAVATAALAGPGPAAGEGVFEFRKTRVANEVARATAPTNTVAMSSQPTPGARSAPKAKRAVAKSIATGITMYGYDESVGSSRVTGRRRSVELVRPQDLDTPSFAGDINAILMSEDLVNYVDDEVRKNVGTLKVQNGFYFRDAENYYVMSRDTRVNRPFVMTYSEEITVRKAMARWMKSYMIAKGIPKILKSRRETKNLAQTYERTMNLTKIEFKSVNPKTGVEWKYAVGVDPFKDGKVTAWSRASNGRWEFEFRQNMQDLSDLYLRAFRIYSFRRKNDISFEQKFYLTSKVYHPRFERAFTKTISTTLEWDIPLANERIAANTLTSLGFKYNF